MIRGAFASRVSALKAAAMTMTAFAIFALSAGDALAQEPKSFTQVKLSEVHIESFIKAQSALAEIAPKILAAGDSPDPGLKNELEALAKANGFSDYAELDDVAATIALVIAGLDSQSGEYADPHDALQKELDDVKKDAGIEDAEKARVVEELNAAITMTPPLQHKENVNVVKTRRAEIEEALQ